ncbi:MAG TPA: potassium channel family protein, partial [Humisphaera sp.]
RLRRRLLGLLGAVVVYLFAASPTLFITLDNPERVSRGMAVLDWSEGLYWSVITFCTVGYGDVVPLTPYARMLSLFNASLGVTLMGVVAGLILGWLTPRRV